MSYRTSDSLISPVLPLETRSRGVSYKELDRFRVLDDLKLCVDHLMFALLVIVAPTLWWSVGRTICMEAARFDVYQLLQVIQQL
ncbi:MAG: hypothetical protein N2C14_20885 [Planctomycetales bacterium]